MSLITVRQASASDCQALAVLFDQYRVSQGQPSNREAGQAFLQARFDRGDSIVFMAWEDSLALGFAQLYPIHSSTVLARAYILNDLFVHESGRCQGVATMLLNAVEDFAWSQGAARVTLNVAIDNLPGQALYEASGWRKDTQYFMFHRYPGST